MDRLFEKAWAFFEPIARPRQVYWALLITIVLLFLAPKNWLAAFGAGEILLLKPYLLVLAALLIALLVVQFLCLFGKWLWRISCKFSDERRLRLIDLPHGSKVLVTHLFNRDPEETRLLNEHPHVLKLRKEKLVKSYSSSVLHGQNFASYRLTERGFRYFYNKLEGAVAEEILAGIREMDLNNYYASVTPDLPYVHFAALR